MPSLSPAIVTGGCGFIGFHLLSGILAEDPNCEIHVIDIFTNRNRVPGVTYHTVDISDAAAVDAIFQAAKPTSIFHVACPDSMVVNDALFTRVNINGARNLLASARKCGTVKAFINTSTSSVIHDNVSDLVNADETWPVLQYPAQKRVYTLTKAVAETEILAANRSQPLHGGGGMLTVSLRPGSCFGPRDTVMMANIVASIRAGQGKYQIGDGRNIYSFTYISNCVDAHLLAAHALVNAYGKPRPSQKDKRVDGEAFHITNDEDWLFWDFQRGIAKAIGMPVKQEEIKVVPVWVALLMAYIAEWITWVRTLGKEQPKITAEAVYLVSHHRTLNGDKAKRVLGYQPKVSMQEGLDIAGRWFVDEEMKAKGLEEERKGRVV
ncbi:hypothetical protein B0H63DRAFT_463284 [Podospora didyma]|uniref:3-beta hydroxysteroid dehydrogenase/isomerase domain-containing protein n=1 Tax=Podospora didyma TaxID=330526 RepID=A0AAE0U3J0_9PEZI|nr:hypothetical protein B0H63DRAFT_463284 [Podospora didyma]